MNQNDTNSPFATTKKKANPRVNVNFNLAEAMRSTQQTRKDPSIEQNRSLREQEKRFLAERLRRERHKEVISTNVFSRAEEERTAEVIKIQQELKLLAKEIITMDYGIQKVIDEDVVDPGDYHISLFQKIKNFLIRLRKKVAESKSWLALSNQRKKAKNIFGQKVKKSETKWFLSPERTSDNQAG